ncbi:hypothetical protein J4420_03450 [Candidatus Woesearchaeota archaeon]|nr:hypothetical protein [Candidatus Woesearchaeota archaeon]
MSLFSKSRKKPRIGDVFVLSFPGGMYCFGRVIQNNAIMCKAPIFNLVYIYKYIKKDKNDVPQDLGVQNLLLPPIVTNNQGWLRGYFETIKTVDIHEGEVLPIHCFENDDFSPAKYFDEDEKELNTKYTICGSYGLASFWYVYKQVSKKLNLPLPALDPEDEKS